MTPRQRAIDALELRRPDRVPHCELEMQLVEEYFGRSYTPSRLYRENPHKTAQYLRNDAELFVATADRFDYCIIHYSRPNMPWDNCIFKGIKPKMYDLMMEFYWKNCWYDTP